MSIASIESEIQLKENLITKQRGIKSDCQDMNEELQTSLTIIKELYDRHCDIFKGHFVNVLCDGYDVALVSAGQLGEAAFDRMRSYEEMNCREIYENEIREINKKIAINQASISNCQLAINDANSDISQLERDIRDLELREEE